MREIGVSTANYAANVPEVNERLGREIDAAIRRAKLTNKKLADAAGVTEPWVKQLRTGRIDRPGAAKLAQIAEVLPVDLNRLLALSDQLGAKVPSAPRGLQITPQDQLILAVQKQTRATEALVARLDYLLFGGPLKYERPPEAEAAFAEAMRIMREEREVPESGPSGLLEGVRRGEDDPAPEALDTRSQSPERLPRGDGAKS